MPKVTRSRRAAPKKEYKRQRDKTPYAYVGLISMVIMTTSGGKATLAHIKSTLKSWFGFFNKESYIGWDSSLRHMLSNKPCFQKILKDPLKPDGKGNWWTVDVNKVDKSFLTLQPTEEGRTGKYPHFLHQHLGFPSIWELAKMTPEQRAAYVIQPKEEDPNSPQAPSPREQTTSDTSDAEQATLSTSDEEQAVYVMPDGVFVMPDAEETPIVPVHQETPESDQQTTLMSRDDIVDVLYPDPREQCTVKACLNLSELVDEEFHTQEEVPHAQEEPPRYTELLRAMPTPDCEMTPLWILANCATEHPRFTVRC